MYVCVLTHCKITRSIVILYQRREPKNRRKASVTSCTIHIHSTHTLYYYLYYTTHTYIQTHTQKANDIKLILFVHLLFLSRAIQTRLLYITIFFHHLLVKYTKQSICFPAQLFVYTYTILLYLLHFFIFQCMSVGVFAYSQTYHQLYNSICYLFIWFSFRNRSFRC